MAIRIQPTGMASLYAKAAKITGEAQAASREAEEARRASQQMMSIQLQRAREQRSHQWQLESEERSHQWEIEKMDMRSRMDFEEKERARQEKRNKFRTTIDSIGEIDTITDEQKEDLKTKATVDFLGISVSDRILFPDLYKSKTGSPYLAGMEARMQQADGQKAVPTEAELRTQRGPEAHKLGVELGYWGD